MAATKYWSKIAIFSHTPCIRRSRRYIAIPFDTQKLEWFGYLTEKSLRIRLLVLTESTNVTDGQTDRHRMTAWAALLRSVAR